MTRGCGFAGGEREIATSSSTAAGPWTTPSHGRRAYLEGHIPGAAFLDVERDLSSPPGPGGRHPLPSPARFAAAAGAAGIGASTFVVAYGSLGGAERLWWLLRHFGHDACAVLSTRRVAGPAPRR